MQAVQPTGSWFLSFPVTGKISSCNFHPLSLPFITRKYRLGTVNRLIIRCKKKKKTPSQWEKGGSTSRNYARSHDNFHSKARKEGERNKKQVTRSPLIIVLINHIILHALTVHLFACRVPKQNPLLKVCNVVPLTPAWSTTFTA